MAFSTAVAAEEVDVGLQLAREQQTRLDGIVVGGQLAAERPVALLQPQRLDRVVAAAGDVERRARGHQVLVDADRELGGDVEFPAQLTHVGDPGRANRRVSQRDPLAGAERERLVAQVGVGERGQQLAGPGSHHAEHRQRRRDVDQLRVAPAGRFLAMWSLSRSVVAALLTIRNSSAAVRVTVTSDS